MADVPGPPGPPPDSDAGDEAAEKEALFFGEKEEPPEIAEDRRHLLKDVWLLRGVVFWGLRIIVRVVLLLILGAIVVWWWHLIGPRTLLGCDVRWLDPEEISRLQAIISSGAISALVALLGKQLFFPRGRP